MSRAWWGKLVFLLGVVLLSGVYVFPTLSNLDVEKSRFPFKQKMNLGLDLQGGLYLVLGVDFNKVYKDVVERQSQSIKDRLAEKKIPVTSVQVVREGFAPDDPRVVIQFDASQREAFYQLLKKEFWSLRLAGESSGRFELGLAHDYRADVRDRTLNQSIEVIRNRIDEFGVSEPSITSQGTDRVVVELPGVKEIDRAKELIGRTAKLEFKLLDDRSMSPAQLYTLIEEIEKKQGFHFKEGDKFSEYVQKVNDGAAGKLPAETQIAFERTKMGSGEARVPHLLVSRSVVTGEDLQDASVQIDSENQRPIVGFTLNPRGASLFERFTGENIGRRLAIVLDGMIYSAPGIQSKIGARGMITLGTGDGESLMKEAKDLAIVLRAGALPAQLDFLEQRVVGPSLGQDSIHKGALASLVGCLAVFLCVGVYYRISGVIAVVSLILNVLFVLAILVGLEATLTLPGIAGIALTVGIAVDSNVVIYERIREELRLGKRPGAAVEAGFRKAFRTILDANITNALAGTVLLLYGTGPIKGFAVTLLVGIVTTVFTAVYVCRLLFDIYLAYLDERGYQTLSI
jgi:preprotein translocase subunit SecD